MNRDDQAGDQQYAGRTEDAVKHGNAAHPRCPVGRTCRYMTARTMDDTGCVLPSAGTVSGLTSNEWLKGWPASSAGGRVLDEQTCGTVSLRYGSSNVHGVVRSGQASGAIQALGWAACTPLRRCSNSCVGLRGCLLTNVRHGELQALATAEVVLFPGDGWG